MNITEKNSKIVGALFIIVYLVFRMAMETFWQHYFYFSYGFEVIFVALAFWVYRKNFSFNRKFDQYDSLSVFLGFVAGFLTYKSANSLNLIVPFDFTALQTILFLLVVAPILEELIFRMALWEAFASLWNNIWFVIATTSFLFALGHFTAYWFVPNELKPFVYFQTTYVFMLAIALGWQRQRKNNLASAMALHFLFNLGFYFGSKF
jgi:membrane protease YdiL (CAAX protease family)